jgi:dCTP deaminase
MILNQKQIIDRMGILDYSKKLMITPLLSHDQIGPTSVDIRLGSSLIIPRRTYVESQDVTNPEKIKMIEKRRYDRVRLKYHNKFVLHPNEIILASTFEYIVLPGDIFCTVASRSSWGRLGLIIATAAAVHPGFKGCLTLELANLSESPIALYPGLSVGQLIFHEVNIAGKESIYAGRYYCPTEAGLPAFFTRSADKEMTFWGMENTRDVNSMQSK